VSKVEEVGVYSTTEQQQSSVSCSFTERAYYCLLCKRYILLQQGHPTQLLVIANCNFEKCLWWILFFSPIWWL